MKFTNTSEATTLTILRRELAAFSAIADSTGRPNLAGVWVEPDRCSIASSNGHSLIAASVKRSADEATLDKRFAKSRRVLLPTADVLWVLNHQGDPADALRFTWKDRSEVAFTLEGRTVMFKTAERQAIFPDWRALLSAPLVPKELIFDPGILAKICAALSSVATRPVDTRVWLSAWTEIPPCSAPNPSMLHMVVQAR